jgi:hypothetical protein
MLNLINRTKTLLVLNLSPCPGSDDCGTCYCSTITHQEPVEFPDGTKGIRQTKRRLPGSLTLLAGESCTAPDWVGRCSEVKRALDRGALRLIQLQAPPAPPVAKSPQAVVSSPQVSRSKSK